MLPKFQKGHKLNLISPWNNYNIRWTLLCRNKFDKALNTGNTAWKVSKYGVISGPYFSVFIPNTEKYRTEITPYLDTFHAVLK